MVLLLGLALAEDWKTIDGKTYEGVTVIKVDADAVTILYKDGGARITLESLSPDLQKKFNYDPELPLLNMMQSVNNPLRLSKKKKLSRAPSSYQMLTTNQRFYLMTLVVSL